MTKASTCLFCQIAAGDAQPHIVYQDKDLIAFLDTGPIRRGHVQIIPRAHYACSDDLPGGLAAKVLMLGQTVAKAQKLLYGVKRAAFMFTGGDIPHAHAHLVPMVENTDITSRRYIVESEITFRAILPASDAELADVAAELKREISQTAPDC